MADERDPTERLRDSRVSQRYREELGAEEPPRALDDAILAASRKGLKKRNWYGPLALAASLVLVVAVAVQVERQQPDEAMVATAPAQPRMQEQAAAPAKEEKAEPFAQRSPAGARAKIASPAATPPAQAAPPPQPAPAPAPREESLRDLAKEQAPRAAEAPAASARSDAAERRAPAAVAAMAAPRPEAWLEQIAELRRQGRHDEADKALAEFRKRHPDYPLTDEMKAKVERK